MPIFSETSLDGAKRLFRSLVPDLTRNSSVADLLLWGVLVAPGVVSNKDTSLTAAWSLTGPDLDSSTPEELFAHAERVNQALTLLGTGWTLHVDSLRQPSHRYPEPTFRHPVAHLVDEDRRQRYAENPLYETHTVLVMTYRAPSETGDSLVRTMLASPGGSAQQDLEARLEYFQTTSRHFIDNLPALHPRPLGDSELLTHLHHCLTGDATPVIAPAEPTEIDHYLATEAIHFAPLRVGSAYVKIVGFSGLPPSTTPALLDAVSVLPFPFRFSSRFMLLDPYDASGVVSARRQAWVRSGRASLSFVLRQIFPSDPKAPAEPQVSQDHHALSMVEDCNSALFHVNQQSSRFGYYTPVFVIHDVDLERLVANTRTLLAAVRDRGVPAREETFNAPEALFGSLPGHTAPNVRRPLVSSRNFADLLPLTSAWAGAPTCPTPLSPPGGHPALLWTETLSTPFRFNLHVDGVGHTLIVGPTGTGKSSFLASLMLSWLRYPNAKVIAFDKGRSLLPVARACGIHYDLGGSRSAFAPLARVDQPKEREFALDWIEVLLMHVRATPLEGHHRRAIGDALDRLAESQPQARTLTNFRLKLMNQELAEALRPYCMVYGGVGSALLDADSEDDHLRESDFIVLETSSLMELGPMYVGPTLSYLFHRIEASLNGDPVLLVLDEAWTFLSHPFFAPRIRRWLLELRKLNAAVVLGTQSLSHLAPGQAKDPGRGDLGAVVLESCPTKVYLPNPQASSEAIRPYYEAFGLNPKQISMIATAQPKRDFYATTPRNGRLFQLPLSPTALAFCGAGSAEEIRRVSELADANPKDWPRHWLLARGLPAAADRLLEIQNSEPNSI